MVRTASPVPNGRDRLAQMQAQQRSAERKRRGALIAAGAVVALALGGGVTYLAMQGDDGTKVSTGGSRGEPDNSIQGMRVWHDLGRGHVEGDPTFAMTPPVGGDHNIAWANCGVYDKAVPNKHAVHSLEHGAVWITYTDKVSKNDLATLKKVAKQDYMLMSPYPDQPSPIVVSAWGYQLQLENASDPRLKTFVDRFLQGEQTPEPGAACSGAYDPATGKIGGQM